MSLLAFGAAARAWQTASLAQAGDETAPADLRVDLGLVNSGLQQGELGSVLGGVLVYGWQNSDLRLVERHAVSGQISGRKLLGNNLLLSERWSETGGFWSVAGRARGLKRVDS